MGAVHLNFSVRNDLLDECSDLVDDDFLNWVHLFHNALHTFVEQDHLVMQLVVHLLGLALEAGR